MDEITAEQAGSIGVAIDECDGFIDNILSTIYKDIRTFAATTGWNTYKHSLPLAFNVPSDDTSEKKSNRQIIIYGTVIKKLRKNGFEVRIGISSKENILYVSWQSNYDSTIFKELQYLIANSTVHDEKEHIKILESEPKKISKPRK